MRYFLLVGLSLVMMSPEAHGGFFKNMKERREARRAQPQAQYIQPTYTQPVYSPQTQVATSNCANGVCPIRR